MKYKVEILPSAWEDLKKIEDYYILQFDVQTALKVSDHILDAIGIIICYKFNKKTKSSNLHCWIAVQFLLYSVSRRGD